MKRERARERERERSDINEKKRGKKEMGEVCEK